MARGIGALPLQYPFRCGIGVIQHNGCEFAELLVTLDVLGCSSDGRKQQVEIVVVRLVLRIDPGAVD